MDIIVCVTDASAIYQIVDRQLFDCGYAIHGNSGIGTRCCSLPLISHGRPDISHVQLFTL